MPPSAPLGPTPDRTPAHTPGNLRYNLLTGRTVRAFGGRNDKYRLKQHDRNVRLNPDAWATSKTAADAMLREDPGRLVRARQANLRRLQDNTKWESRIFRGGKGEWVEVLRDNNRGERFIQLGSQAHRALVLTNNERRIRAIQPNDNPRRFRRVYELADHPTDVARLAGLTGDERSEATRRARQEFIARFTGTPVEFAAEDLADRLSEVRRMYLAVITQETQTNGRFSNARHQNADDPMVAGFGPPGESGKPWIFIDGHDPNRSQNRGLHGLAGELRVVYIEVSAIARVLGDDQAAHVWLGADGFPGVPAGEFIGDEVEPGRFEAVIEDGDPVWARMKPYIRRVLQSSPDARVSFWFGEVRVPNDGRQPTNVAQQPLLMQASPTPAATIPGSFSPDSLLGGVEGGGRGLLDPVPATLPRTLMKPCGLRALAHLLGEHKWRPAELNDMQRLLGVRKITEEFLLGEIPLVVPSGGKRPLLESTGTTFKLFDDEAITLERIALLFRALKVCGVAVQQQSGEVVWSYVPWQDIPEMQDRDRPKFGFAYISGHIEPIVGRRAVGFGKAYTFNADKSGFVRDNSGGTRKDMMTLEKPSAVRKALQPMDASTAKLCTDPDELLSMFDEYQNIWLTGGLHRWVVESYTRGLLSISVLAFDVEITAASVVHGDKAVTIRMFPDGMKHPPTTDEHLRIMIELTNSLYDRFLKRFSRYGPGVLEAFRTGTIVAVDGLFDGAQPLTPDNPVVEVDICGSHAFFLSGCKKLPELCEADVLEDPSTLDAKPLRDHDFVLCRCKHGARHVVFAEDNVVMVDGWSYNEMHKLAPGVLCIEAVIRPVRLLDNPGLKCCQDAQDQGLPYNTVKEVFNNVSGMLEKVKNKIWRTVLCKDIEEAERIAEIFGKLSPKVDKFDPVNGKTCAYMKVSRSTVFSNGALPIKAMLKAREAVFQEKLIRQMDGIGAEIVAIKSDALFVPSGYSNAVEEYLSEIGLLWDPSNERYSTRIGKVRLSDDKFLEKRKLARGKSCWVNTGEMVYCDKLLKLVPERKPYEVKRYEYPVYDDDEGSMVHYFHGLAGTGKTTRIAKYLQEHQPMDPERWIAVLKTESAVKTVLRLNAHDLFESMFDLDTGRITIEDCEDFGGSEAFQEELRAMGIDVTVQEWVDETNVDPEFYLTVSFDPEGTSEVDLQVVLASRICVYIMSVVRTEFERSGAVLRNAFLEARSSAVLIGPTNVIARRKAVEYGGILKWADIQGWTMHHATGSGICDDNRSRGENPLIKLEGGHALILEEFDMNSVSQKLKFFRHMPDLRKKVKHIVACGDSWQLPSPEDHHSLNNVSDRSAYHMHVNRMIFGVRGMEELKTLYRFPNPVHQEIIMWAVDALKNKNAPLKFVVDELVRVAGSKKMTMREAIGKGLLSNPWTPFVYHCRATSNQAVQRFSSTTGARVRAIQAFSSNGYKIVRGEEYVVTARKRAEYHLQLEGDPTVIRVDAQPIDKLRMNFVHPSCNTVYSAQGETFDDHVLIADWDSPYAFQQWLYVAITRARDLSKMIFLTDGNDHYAALKQILKTKEVGYFRQDEAAERGKSTLTSAEMYEMIKAQNFRCGGCSADLAWIDHNGQPTGRFIEFDREDSTAPHSAANCSAKCDRCNGAMSGTSRDRPDRRAPRTEMFE